MLFPWVYVQMFFYWFVSEWYEFCLSLKIINQFGYYLLLIDVVLVNWFHGWRVQVFMYTCDDILSGGSHGRRPSCEPAGVSSPDPQSPVSFAYLCQVDPFCSFFLFFFWDEKKTARFVTRTNPKAYVIWWWGTNERLRWHAARSTRMHVWNELMTRSSKSA